MASAVYSGLGLKRTLGPLFAVAVVGPVGFGIGGGVFCPSATPATRPVEFSGPVPPTTPCGMPATATGPLPFMFWPVGEPEPRLTTDAPAPLFAFGILDIPASPRLMAVGEGLFETAMGFVAEPSATAAGFAALFGTVAGIAWARLTTLGAGGG